MLDSSHYYQYIHTNMRLGGDKGYSLFSVYVLKNKSSGWQKRQTFKKALCLGAVGEWRLTVSLGLGGVYWYKTHTSLGFGIDLRTVLRWHSASKH